MWNSIWKSFLLIVCDLMSYRVAFFIIESVKLAFTINLNMWIVDTHSKNDISWWCQLRRICYDQGWVLWSRYKGNMHWSWIACFTRAAHEGEPHFDFLNFCWWEYLDFSWSRFRLFLNRSLVIHFSENPNDSNFLHYYYYVMGDWAPPLCSPRFIWNPPHELKTKIKIHTHTHTHPTHQPPPQCSCCYLFAFYQFELWTTCIELASRLKSMVCSDTLSL